MGRRIALLIALAPAAAMSTLAFAHPAEAETAQQPGSATAFLKAKHATLETLLKGPAPERDKKVDAELVALVDYDDMAKTALGPNWEKRSDAERKELTALLRQLIERNYKKRLNQTLDYQIAYKGEVPKGGDFLVQTEAKSLKDKRAAPVLVDYLLRKKANGYTVVDLIPEGSSMIQTYRKEFTKVINKDGWDALIKKMKDKLAKT